MRQFTFVTPCLLLALVASAAAGVGTPEEVAPTIEASIDSRNLVGYADLLADGFVRRNVACGVVESREEELELMGRLLDSADVSFSVNDSRLEVGPDGILLLLAYESLLVRADSGFRVSTVDTLSLRQEEDQTWAIAVWTELSFDTSQCGGWSAARRALVGDAETVVRETTFGRLKLWQSIPVGRGGDVPE